MKALFPGGFKTLGLGIEKKIIYTLLFVIAIYIIFKKVFK